MNRSLPAVLTAGFFALALSCGQSGQEQSSQVQPLVAKPAFADSLADLIAPEAKLEKVTEGLKFTLCGAPCWYDGRLFFSNISYNPPEDSRTYRRGSGGNTHLIRENNGVITAMQPTGTGTFYCCETGAHRITEMDYQGKVIRTVASDYQGVRLDEPCDLVIDAKGGIYFTDPHATGTDFAQPVPGVYYITPDETVARVIDDLFMPRGVSLSPDGAVLYVISTRGWDKGQEVFAYNVNPDGSLANKRLFCLLKMTHADQIDPEGTSGATGCAMDAGGNLYVATTRGLGLQVFNAAGEYLGNIVTVPSINDCAFGGTDLQTLYVTAADGIYAIATLLPGLRINSSK